MVLASHGQAKLILVNLMNGGLMYSHLHLTLEIRQFLPVLVTIINMLTPYPAITGT
jgi:hypothetical protein